MTPEKSNIYTAEFRASAVKLANESEKPITQVAKYLGINVNTGPGSGNTVGLKRTIKRYEATSIFTTNSNASRKK
jgi:hypothetical protein